MTTESSTFVITDLSISFSFSNNITLETKGWHRLDKDLYLHTAAGRSAWLHVAQATEKELTASQLVVTNISIGGPPSATDSPDTWEKRPAGLWVQRKYYTVEIGELVTNIDVLFGMDAVDPRPQWRLFNEFLHLENPPSQTPIARPTVRYGRPNPNTDRPTLRTREDGSFKIIQISDTHMVTGIGSCKNAIDADGKPLQETNADLLTVKFIGTILDSEKPDVVVLTGDQLHHDILDSQTTLFKVVAPTIQRSIPWAAVFGNHDSEGDFALSRELLLALRL